MNARGASRSILATIHGFRSFDPGSDIRGVILNQCTAGTYAAVADAIREHFGGAVRPLGFLPRLPDCALETVTSASSRPPRSRT